MSKTHLKKDDTKTLCGIYFDFMRVDVVELPPEATCKNCRGASSELDTPTTSGSDEPITPTARALADIFWKFHNDRLDDPSISEMKPYVQPVLDLVAEAGIAARIDEIKHPRKYSKSVVAPDGYNEGYWDAHNQVGKADEIRVLELEAELQQLRKKRESDKQINHTRSN